MWRCLFAPFYSTVPPDGELLVHRAWSTRVTNTDELWRESRVRWHRNQTRQEMKCVESCPYGRGSEDWDDLSADIKKGDTHQPKQHQPTVFHIMTWSHNYHLKTIYKSWSFTVKSQTFEQDLIWVFSSFFFWYRQEISDQFIKSNVMYKCYR